VEAMLIKTMRNQHQSYKHLLPRKEVLHGITNEQRIKKGIYFKEND